MDPFSQVFQGFLIAALESRKSFSLFSTEKENLQLPCHFRLASGTLQTWNNDFSLCRIQNMPGCPEGGEGPAIEL